MNRYTEVDELLNLQIRLRHETLPICPPVPVVELPDGSHVCSAPPDPYAWLDALGAPATVVVPPVVAAPVVRTPRRWLALACGIVPLLALAGEFAGRWAR